MVQSDEELTINRYVSIDKSVETDDATIRAHSSSAVNEIHFYFLSIALSLLCIQHPSTQCTLDVQVCVRFNVESRWRI